MISGSHVAHIEVFTFCNGKQQPASFDSDVLHEGGSAYREGLSKVGLNEIRFISVRIRSLAAGLDSSWAGTRSQLALPVARVLNGHNSSS